LLLNVAGINNQLDDTTSSFDIEVPQQELLLKWSSLSHPIAEIDTHIIKLFETTPAILDFSKWGIYLPQTFQIKLIKDKYFDIPNTTDLLTLIRPIVNE
jgi:ATP-dependent Lhr-like helicase